MKRHDLRVPHLRLRVHWAGLLLLRFRSRVRGRWLLRSQVPVLGRLHAVGLSLRLVALSWNIKHAWEFVVSWLAPTLAKRSHTNDRLWFAFVYHIRKVLIVGQASFWSLSNVSIVGCLEKYIGQGLFKFSMVTETGIEVRPKAFRFFNLGLRP